MRSRTSTSTCLSMASCTVDSRSDTRGSTAPAREPALERHMRVRGTNACALHGETQTAARRDNSARTPPHNRRTQPGAETHNNSHDRVAFVPLVCARWPLSSLRAATGLSGQLPTADAAFSARSLSQWADCLERSRRALVVYD
jgi:hypothetical protein